MKSRYNSTIQHDQNQQYHIPINQSKAHHRAPRYQPRSPPIIEIYDLEALEMDNSPSSSLSSCSSSSNENLTSSFQTQQYQQQLSLGLFNSSLTSHSRHSSSSSPSSASLYSESSAFEEPFTFQEFISSIINCNDKKWHRLIIQDLARLLEHNFKDFKKVFSKHTDQNQQQRPGLIYINSDTFTFIAERVFQLASEEPNGILGAVINLRLLCDNGQVFDICRGVAYDPSTLAMSQINITLKEDVTGLKKFFQAFKLYSNIGKYLSVHIDSKNFDVEKLRLYDY